MTAKQTLWMRPCWYLTWAQLLDQWFLNFFERDPNLEFYEHLMTQTSNIEKMYFEC